MAVWYNVASISSFSLPVIRNCLLFGFASSVLPPTSRQEKIADYSGDF